jgi:hypothetical protein
MSQAERMQEIWRSYEAEHDHLPASAREVVEWAVRERKLVPPRTDPLDVLAGQMASALREEYATDPNGNRYRVNHAVRVTKNGVPCPGANGSNEGERCSSSYKPIELIELSPKFGRC